MFAKYTLQYVRSELIERVFDEEVAPNSDANPDRSRRRIDRFSVTPFALVSAAKVHPLALRVVRAGSKACRNAVALGRFHPRVL
jgi:hypothetical protein